MQTKPAKQAIEAYGVRGFRNKPWRKTFKSQMALEKWLTADKQWGDVTVYGTRDIEKGTKP